MKKKSLRLVPLLALLCLSSCKTDNPQKNLQTLHLNLYQDPISLDPRVVRSLKDLTVVKQLFEGLMRLDASGKPQPALAANVEISSDLLTYTFHLREAYWNNGDPVTSYDFHYAWTETLRTNFASDYAYMLYPIKNAQSIRENKDEPESLAIQVLDAKTFSVELHKPTPYFLELLAFPTFFPINHKVACKQKNWAQPPGEHFVSNGPFLLKTWNPQSELILEKNPTYWDAGSVYLDQIAFTMIADNNTEGLLFEKEELDWLGQPISNNIASEILEKSKEQGELHSYPVAGTLWLVFNTEKEPFHSRTLRQALSYAIDRQEMIQHILQGNQTPATGPLPPSMAVTDTPYFQDRDFEAAQHLIQIAKEENAWESVPKIVLSYGTSERNAKIAQLLQQQWKKALGLEVELQTLERELYRATLRKGEFSVGIGEWVADYNDPTAFLELFKHKNDENGNGMNPSGWQNEHFIALLDQSLTEQNAQKRQKILHAAEKLMMEEMPIAPLYHYAFDYAKKPYVQDVVLSPLGPADFKSTRLIHLRGFQ